MGQTPHRTDILNVTNALPCVVQTTEEHGYSTGDFVRLTNLNMTTRTVGVDRVVAARGMDQLNNYNFKIIVLGVDTFSLLDQNTLKEINSTSYVPYVSGGYCNKIATEFFYEDNDE
jgi:hypothetical protein